MNEELTNLLEGIDTANNIKQYEEGVADQLHKAGNAIKNFFGTKAGAAQRAQADAQKNLQTAQANQQANQMNAEANAISGPEAAQNIINLLQKAFKKDLKTQANVDKKNADNEQKQKVEAAKNNGGNQ